MSSPCGLVVVAASADLDDGTSVYAIGPVRRKQARRPKSNRISRLLVERSFPGDMEGVNALRRTDDQNARPADKETGLNYAGDEVQCRFQFTRPIDAVDMDVDNKMTSLSLKRRPIALSEYHAAFGEHFT